MAMAFSVSDLARDVREEADQVTVVSEMPIREAAAFCLPRFPGKFCALVQSIYILAFRILARSIIQVE